MDRNFRFQNGLTLLSRIGTSRSKSKKSVVILRCGIYLSDDMTKPTKWVWAQRRLRSAWASAQSDQSSLCAHWVARDPSFLHADSKDSDQTGRMPRLSWVFAGRTLILLVLSCRGSFRSYPCCLAFCFSYVFGFRFCICTIGICDCCVELIWHQ